MKNEVKPAEAWDVTQGLVECPNSKDLIGFVTSGAYNLSEGRGTAIGGVWAQRVIKGWRQEGNVANGISQDVSTNGVATGPSATASGRSREKSSAAQRDQNTRRRDRQLCIVRNAGESVGRLAVWELCE